MKVLLCTPYGINPQMVQGGITIWAHNIVDYYQTLNTGIDLEVVPYDRKIQKKTGLCFLSRAWGGIADYREAVKNTREAWGQDCGTLSFWKDTRIGAATEMGMETATQGSPPR